MDSRVRGNDMIGFLSSVIPDEQCSALFDYAGIRAARLSTNTPSSRWRRGEREVGSRQRANNTSKHTPCAHHSHIMDYFSHAEQNHRA
jgi:alpha-L-fucosidase